MAEGPTDSDISLNIFSNVRGTLYDSVSRVLHRHNQLDITCEELYREYGIKVRKETRKHPSAVSGDLIYNYELEGSDAQMQKARHYIMFKYRNLELSNFRDEQCKTDQPVTIARELGESDSASISEEMRLCQWDGEPVFNWHCSPPIGALVLHTRDAMMVSVFKMNITKLEVDAIVSPCGKKVGEGGSLSRAIKAQAGKHFIRVCAEEANHHGEMKVTDVVVTSAGELPCKYVMHARTPSWYEESNSVLNEKHLKDTFYNCISKANQRGLRSLAMPALAAGTITKLSIQYDHI